MRLRTKLGLIFGFIAGIISLILSYQSMVFFGGSKIKTILHLLILIPIIIQFIIYFVVGLIIGGVIGLIIEKIKK